MLTRHVSIHAALYTTRKGWGFFAQELPRLSRALRRAGIYLTPSWVDAANRELEAWCKARADATVRSLEAEGPSSSSSLNTADDPVVVRALLAGIEREQESSGAASPLYPTAIRRRELSVASEILDHVLAGQETTGVALTYLAYHLSRRPGLQRELRDELLTLRPNMKLGGEDGAAAAAAHPDSRRLDGLPLLHAVIMETVRRHAPAGGPEPRVAPACRIGPYEVPAGVRVSASAFNLHRNEVAFPEPETWDHTRWLQQADLADDGGGGGGGGEKMTDVNRHFWGFSSGGRMCLGSNFAMHGWWIFSPFLSISLLPSTVFLFFFRPFIEDSLCSNSPKCVADLSFARYETCHRRHLFQLHQSYYRRRRHRRD